MAKYAKGKKSQAISDRSGFKVPYKDLKTTWDGLRVEPQEFEPKHPQLDPPKNVVDATALFKPRPDNDPVNIRIDLAFNWFNNNLTGTTMNARSYEKPNVGASGLGAIGTTAINLGGWSQDSYGGGSYGDT